MTRICRGVLAELGRPTSEAIACPTPESAWRQMLEAARPEDLACVTGSFFIVGEVRRLAGCLTTGASSS
jgi:folylpolyglutamate synthase/dihydropteroate synthase